jgi:hypothetical protein
VIKAGIFITVLFMFFSVLFAQALNDHSSRHALTQKQIVSEIGFTGYIQGIPGAAVYAKVIPETDDKLLTIIYHAEPDGIAIADLSGGRIISSCALGANLARLDFSPDGRWAVVTDRGIDGVLGDNRIWVIDLKSIFRPSIAAIWRILTSDEVLDRIYQPFGVVVKQKGSVISAIVTMYKSEWEVVIHDIREDLRPYYREIIPDRVIQDYISLPGDNPFGIASLDFLHSSGDLVFNDVTDNYGDVDGAIATMYVPGAIDVWVKEDTILCVCLPAVEQYFPDIGQGHTIQFIRNLWAAFFPAVVESVKTSEFIDIQGYNPQGLKFTEDGHYVFVANYQNPDTTGPMISVINRYGIPIDITINGADSIDTGRVVSKMPLLPQVRDAQLQIVGDNLVICEGDSANGAFVFSTGHYLRMLRLDFEDIVNGFESVNLVSPLAMVKNPRDGDQFALADKNSIYLMDNQGLKLPIDMEDVRDLHFSPNGQVLYAVDSRGWLLAIDVNPTSPDFLEVITQTRIINEEFSQVHIASTSDGRYLFATFTTGKGAATMVIYAYSYYPLSETPEGERPRTISDITVNNGKIYQVEQIPQGDYEIGIYELNDDFMLRRTGQITGIGQPVRLESVPESNLILATFSDGTIKLIDATGRITYARIIKGLIPTVGAVISSGGKKALVCVEKDGQKKLVSVDIQRQDVLQDNWTSQNYPNPFSDQTTIELEIRKYFKQAWLKIYNIRGQLVKKIEVHPGQTKVIWKSDNSQGKQVASGIYFYRLEIDGRNQKHAKRMLLF